MAVRKAPLRGENPATQAGRVRIKLVTRGYYTASVASNSISGRSLACVKHQEASEL